MPILEVKPIYTDPYDDINVVKIELDDGVSVKAFKLTKNIFLSPEPSYIKDTEVTLSERDDYIQSMYGVDGDVKRQQFIDDIYYQMQMIQRGASGKLLIDEIDGLIPLPTAYGARYRKDDHENLFELQDYFIRNKIIDNIRNGLFKIEDGYFTQELQTGSDKGKIKKIGNVLIMAEHPRIEGKKKSMDLGYSFETGNAMFRNSFGSKSIISINPRTSQRLHSSGKIMSPWIRLAHELIHSHQRLLDVDLSGEMAKVRNYFGDLGPIPVGGSKNTPVIEIYNCNIEEKRRIYLEKIREYGEDRRKTSSDRIYNLIEKALALVTNITEEEKLNIQRRITYRKGLVEDFLNRPTEESIIYDTYMNTIDTQPEITSKRKDQIKKKIKDYSRKGYNDTTGKEYKLDAAKNPNFGSAEDLRDIPSCSYAKQKRAIGRGGGRLISTTAACISPNIPGEKISKEKLRNLYIDKSKYNKKTASIVSKANIDVKEIRKILTEGKVKFFFVDARQTYIPNTKVIIYEKTVRKINAGLNSKAMTVLDLYHWVKGIILAYTSDLDRFSKIVAYAGIIPVAGDLMQISEEIRHKNYSGAGFQTAVLSVFIGAALLAAVGSPVGIGILVIMGAAFAGLSIGRLIKDIIEWGKSKEDKQEKELIKYRDEVWKRMVKEVFNKNVVPEMENIYRTWEQGARESLELTINVIKAKTEHLERGEKAKIQIELEIDNMRKKFDDMLVGAVSQIKRSMKQELENLTRDYYAEYFKTNSEKIIDGLRSQLVKEFASTRLADQSWWGNKRGIIDMSMDQYLKLRQIIIDTPMSLKDLSWLDECINEQHFQPNFIFPTGPIRKLYVEYKIKDTSPSIIGSQNIVINWDCPKNIPKELGIAAKIEVREFNDDDRESHMISSELVWEKNYAIQFRNAKFIFTRSKFIRYEFSITPYTSVSPDQPGGETMILKLRFDRNLNTYGSSTINNGERPSDYDYLLPKPYNQYLIFDYYPDSVMAFRDKNDLTASIRQDVKSKENYMRCRFVPLKEDSYNSYHILINKDGEWRILELNEDSSKKAYSLRIRERKTSDEENHWRRWRIHFTQDGKINFSCIALPNKKLGRRHRSLSWTIEDLEDWSVTDFTLVLSGSEEIIDNKCYSIVSSQNNMAVTVSPFYPSSPITWSFDGNPTQLWLSEQADGEAWNFKNVHAQKYLEVEHEAQFEDLRIANIVLSEKNEKNENRLKIHVQGIDMRGLTKVTPYNNKSLVLDIFKQGDKKNEKGQKLIMFHEDIKERKKLDWVFSEFPALRTPYTISALKTLRILSGKDKLTVDNHDISEFQLASDKNNQWFFEKYTEDLYMIFNCGSGKALKQIKNKVGLRDTASLEVMPLKRDSSFRAEEYLWSMVYDDREEGWNIVSAGSDREAIRVSISEENKVAITISKPYGREYLFRIVPVKVDEILLEKEATYVISNADGLVITRSSKKELQDGNWLTGVIDAPLKMTPISYTTRFKPSSFQKWELKRIRAIYNDEKKYFWAFVNNIESYEEGNTKLYFFNSDPDNSPIRQASSHYFAFLIFYYGGKYMIKIEKKDESDLSLPVITYQPPEKEEEKISDVLFLKKEILDRNDSKLLSQLWYFTKLDSDDEF
ncbi:hypothetical protein IQ37_02285 [Chryseobacterium piperi]|uniref:Uncharacterized protein n=1 Tax=Chryseobacterium piperi TaxID=558152 RepID=A0A086BM56_9FLAO|nr:RICIN domain-containing protein [Chryseobacterium piperi]ASW75385.1 hypothetical protein CJF12_14550 [Chryseobacterium piperi]KFF30020.1 hypothetical protein IQ37_02285 [Chryseobacterium piperi]